ncbi:response regulator [Candidatus Parcubacteria bacterium]|nr:response regulator [Candidatus Parcubacteria bacterium]
MNTILLVEDDPSLIDIYTTKLKQDGFSVRVAKNGQEAFELLKKEVPDLLVLDIVLPQVDGWDVLSKIKENKKWEKIPIVILSNLGQKAEVEKGLKLGAEEYLIKAHYTPSEIVEEIKKILK